jgi:hypothetical protein
MLFCMDLVPNKSLTSITLAEYCHVNRESVDVSTTRGTTAMVYCLIAAYIQVLYKGGGVHPNWLDGQ